MKTLHYYTLTFLSLFCATCLMTSCDEDEHIGTYVSGHWFGDMDMYVDGEKARGSEIEFMPTGWGYTSGRGVEVDYYRLGSITHKFTYRIRDEIIYMAFDDPALDCAIVDYRLDSYNFSGYIADYYTLENQTYFKLRNYDRYWDDYGYYNDYYVKANVFSLDSIGENQTSEPKCIRGVNMKK